jgi:hypothetical protein
MCQVGHTMATDTTVCLYRPRFVPFRSVPFRFVWLQTILHYELSFFVSHTLVAPCELVIQTSSVSVLHFLGAFAIFRKATISFVVSVFPPVHNGRIFMKFGIWVFFRKSVEIFNFHCNPTRLTVLNIKTAVHFRSHLAQFFAEWEMFQTKLCRKSKHTFHVLYRCSENSAGCGKMWKITGEPGKPQMTVEYGACALPTG